MLRQLLTLLAVISGFTLAAEPVSAAQGTAVSVTATSEAGDQQAAAYRLSEHLRIVEKTNAPILHVAERQIAIPLAPAIRLQADRARE